MAFRIIRNDITRVRADAIVNTANPQVAVGAGVDMAVYEAAGREQLLAARAKIGILREGEVGITPAFGLPAKYIIHSSGPVWTGRKGLETGLLRQCYNKALYLALEYGCKSIAFPLMGTGSYGFPKELGLQTAVDSFRDFLEEHEMEIILVVFGSYEYKISGELLEEMQSFIDERYVQSVYCSEYKNASRKRNPCSRCVEESSIPLDELLRRMHRDTFENHLQQFINKKGMKNSEVYAAANISKQYFSKLMKGQVKPSKSKVLSLAVGLRLNLDETVDFLRIAGYALSPVSQTDIVVEYFIRKQDYNVIKIDIVLFDYGLTPLSE